MCSGRHRLRSVAHTAPYLHDGSIATLEEAVRLMARVELGLVLGARQVREVTAFLRAAGDLDPRRTP